MRAREILAQNVRALIDHAREDKPALGTIQKVADQSKGGLTNGTVGRVVKASNATNIDTLDGLAEVFGLQPWQLLVENLSPKALPHLVDPALLTELRQIVGSVPSVTAEIPSSHPGERRLQGEKSSRPVKVGPALQAAQEPIIQGVDNDASSRAAALPKPKGGRRR